MKRLLILGVLFVILISGCQFSEVKEIRQLMGTVVTITVIGDRDNAELAIGRAFKEIERIDYLLSEYKNDSEVYFLNTNGYLADPSSDLIYNLEKAQYYSELSNGAFDVTVQPILDLYKESFSVANRPPSEKDINETSRFVNYKNIIIDKENIKFKAKNMKLTLGGIAKGYAIDRAIQLLQENGIKEA